MTPVGFEPTISAGERPKTYALDRAATGTGVIFLIIQTENLASVFEISLLTKILNGILPVFFFKRISLSLVTV